MSKALDLIKYCLENVMTDMTHKQVIDVGKKLHELEQALKPKIADDVIKIIKEELGIVAHYDEESKVFYIDYDNYEFTSFQDNKLIIDLNAPISVWSIIVRFYEGVEKND